MYSQIKYWLAAYIPRPSKGVNFQPLGLFLVVKGLNFHTLGGFRYIISILCMFVLDSYCYFPRFHDV